MKPDTSTEAVAYFITLIRGNTPSLTVAPATVPSGPLEVADLLEALAAERDELRKRAGIITVSSNNEREITLFGGEELREEILAENARTDKIMALARAEGRRAGLAEAARAVKEVQSRPHRVLTDPLMYQQGWIDGCEYVIKAIRALAEPQNGEGETIP